MMTSVLVPRNGLCVVLRGSRGALTHGIFLSGLALSAVAAVPPANAAEVNGLCQDVFKTSASGQTEAQTSAPATQAPDPIPYERQKDDEDDDARWVRVYSAYRKRFKKTEQPKLVAGDHEKSDILLAWLEARSGRLGFDLKQSPKDLGHLERQDFYVEKIAGLAKKKKISGRKIEMLMYKLLTIPPEGRWARFKDRFTPNVAREIHRRVAAEILTHDLLTAFADLGLETRPHARENLRTRLYAGGGFDWALSSALNVLAAPWESVFLGQTAMPLLLLPKAKFERGVRIPDHLRRKILEQGFDSARDELMQHFRVPATATWVWNTARSAFYVAVVMVYLESLADVDSSLVLDAWNELLGLNPDRAQISSALSSAEAETEILSGWRQWYASVHRHAPSEAEVAERRQTLRGWTGFESP